MKMLKYPRKSSLWGLVVLATVLAVLSGGCSAVERLTGSQEGAEQAAVPAVAAEPDPSPTPVVVSTPAPADEGQQDSNRRLDTLSMTYNGEIMADTVVPVVAEAAGQIMEVPVHVGDSVEQGDLLVRIDSTVSEAQHAQALAALELAQQEPKESDLEAARSGVTAARAAYNRALQGPTEEDKRMALAQLRQAEAAVQLYQAQYDRIAGSPLAGMMPEALQLQQATLTLEAAQASYDKVLKGTTADVIDGAYAQLAAAEAQLDRLKRGAEPAQIKAAEAGVKQAEVAVYLAQLQLDKATVESPADGFIYQLDAVEGGMAGPGVALAVIFSHDVKILIPVEEFRSQEVYVGEPVDIRVDAYPDRSFPGEIREIAPTFDHATRTVQVTVKPTGADAGDLKPGMFATVQLLEQ